jgi:hypothetical protein
MDLMTFVYYFGATVLKVLHDKQEPGNEITTTY